MFISPSNLLSILSGHLQKSLTYNSSFWFLKTSIVYPWWFLPLTEHEDYTGGFLPHTEA